jgi:hypothetical protein
MRRPNFFIIGARKSGTTAMAEYLSGHPQIFMSSPKEPNYFADDLPGARAVCSAAHYLSLFQYAPERAQILGEASTIYLFSQTALANILNFNPDAKILVMLRNPVDFVYSLHSQHLYTCEEVETDFETAWHLQVSRAQGEQIPASCREPANLQYRQFALFGEQIERVQALVPPEQLKVILFDDFKTSTRAVYQEILAFLGVADDGKTEFPVINEQKRNRNPTLSRLIKRMRKLYRNENARFLLKFKYLLGLERISIIDRLTQANVQKNTQPPLSPQLRAQLQTEFAPDIAKLSQLIQRDLSRWLS